ncbi:MAG: quinolinate synthase NadA [Desulfatiglans sp.]|jgi:quinolinate synthase|nr:quinolinate synthase NadA [Desulfatiglans sp.]
MGTTIEHIDDLKKKIRGLLKEKNAILLAHNYQRAEIQDVADLCGDSLELSIKASKTEKDVIVFCGVHFMAETASILSPNKTVLLPVAAAGCPMADMITARELIEEKKKNPGRVIVSYVNTTADVKAESDICCTSANVVKVVESIDPDKEIFMTPDRNLAQYAKSRTQRRITWWNGFCPTHNNLKPSQVKKVKAKNPDALFLAHPECTPEVLALADEIKSTSGIIAFIRNSSHKKFIIGTETGIIHPLKKANPDKEFIPADPDMICANMKKTGLLDVVKALEQMKTIVKVPEETANRARIAVEKMLAIPAG